MSEMAVKPLSIQQAKTIQALAEACNINSTMIVHSYIEQTVMSLNDKFLDAFLFDVLSDKDDMYCTKTKLSFPIVYRYAKPYAQASCNLLSETVEDKIRSIVGRVRTLELAQDSDDLIVWHKGAQLVTKEQMLEACYGGVDSLLSQVKKKMTAEHLNDANTPVIAGLLN